MTAFEARAGDPASASDPPAHAASQPALPIAAAPDANVTVEAVTHALETVFDPELGMSVVQLGLVYGVEIHNRDVRITMTLTAPGCPIHDVMPEWVRQAVGTAWGRARHGDPDVRSAVES